MEENRNQQHAEPTERPGVAETRQFRRFIITAVTAVLLVIAALLYPLVSVSLATPRNDPRHGEAIQALYAKRAADNNAETYSFDDIEQVQLTLDAKLDEATLPIWQSLNQLNHNTFLNWDLDVQLRPQYAFEDAFELTPPYDTGTEKQRAMEVNAAARDHARRAIDAVIAANCFAPLEELLKDTYPAGVGPLNPSFQPLRLASFAINEAGQWLLFGVRLEAERGNLEAAESLLDRHHALCVKAGIDPHPFAAIGTLRHIQEHLETIRRITTERLDANALNTSDLERLLDRASKISLDLDFKEAAEIDRLLLLDLGERTHSAGGVRLPDALRSHYNGFKPGPSPVNIAGLFAPRHAEYEQAVADYHARMLAHLALPIEQQAVLPNLTDLEAVFNTPSPATTLDIYLSMPVVLEQRNETITALNATRTRLAIELHRAKTGSLPTSLNDLVGTTLDELPRDAESSAATLIYAPLPNAPRGFTLLSTTREWHIEPE